ncbi:MAG: DUF5132 domain-containing protein [Methylohalobius sp.]|nr:DUF5132 domain-containing protein [Methylohalobius sp.]
MNEDTLKGIAIGAGAVVAAFLAKSALSGSGGRALVRATVKTGLLAFEKTREVVAEAVENLEDIVAEVQDELRAEKMAQSQAAPPSEE